jgi:hypothetical protein
MTKARRVAVIGTAGWAGSRHAHSFRSHHEWDRYGSETVRHFPEIDLFRKQAEAALLFAGGRPPAVGYRQALRATEIADAILARMRERI